MTTILKTIRCIRCNQKWTGRCEAKLKTVCCPRCGKEMGR